MPTLPILAHTNSHTLEPQFSLKSAVAPIRNFRHGPFWDRWQGGNLSDRVGWIQSLKNLITSLYRLSGELCACISIAYSDREYLLGLSLGLILLVTLIPVAWVCHFIDRPWAPVATFACMCRMTSLCLHLTDKQPSMLHLSHPIRAGFRLGW